ncbi:MAG: ABC transporter ATP-binding protein [Proteobacteria bacterium]|nr:ABC transporter ATP-binding protein [Pseudomonadota bacterium]
MIELRNLTKRYGTFCAVHDLTLQVGAGEIFGFLGVNGAGKTTTLRMLAGILQPTSGIIRIGGYDMSSEPQRAKAITGFIPDRPHLYSRLTAYEFLRFSAELYQVDTAEIDQRIHALLEEYRLTEWTHELIESFSHGMKQRVATCAALVHRPKLLIVDEPMVGLDPHGAKLLKESLKRYASTGTTVLLSTHSLNVAEELSDRLAIINRGSIIALGTLAEIRSLAGREEMALEQLFLELTNTPLN